MRRLALLAVAAGVLTGSLALTAAAQAGSKSKKSTTWNVKITNLTSAQAFSPPLWVVHTKKLDVWSVGEQASNGLALIAEDANNGPLQALYDADNRRVRDADTVAGGPIGPGGVREFRITSRGNFDRLSLVWMLVCTNDAFSGVDSIQINSKRSRSRTTNAYDAGTEKNNEQAAYIPCPPGPNPPFGNFGVRDVDAQLITRHPGIVGGDLTPYAWTDPVARVETRKVR